MSTPEFVRGMDVPPGTVLPEGFELGDGTRRLASCVNTWPECSSSEYSPYCCRFPKSCSATSVPNRVYRTGDLEPAAEPACDCGAVPPAKHEHTCTWGQWHLLKEHGLLPASARVENTDEAEPESLWRSLVEAEMRHRGYPDEEIESASRVPAHTSDCEFETNGYSWNCLDEEGKSYHPIADEYDDIAGVIGRALEAAALFLQPQPVDRPLLGREAVEGIIAVEAMAYDSVEDVLAVDDGDPDTLRRATDAVMELARPMPTREALTERVAMAMSLVRFSDEESDRMIELTMREAWPLARKAVEALLGGVDESACTLSPDCPWTRPHYHRGDDETVFTDSGSVLNEGTGVMRLRVDESGKS